MENLYENEIFFKKVSQKFQWSVVNPGARPGSLRPWLIIYVYYHLRLVKKSPVGGRR